MYSVLVHSVGVALIIWNFTGDKKQAIAGLLHDISSPAFKHCIDFLNGDAENQETTEEDTENVIKNSKEIMELLKRDNLKLEEVSDYKIYPIADNKAPKLSADRLEYTFQNGRYFKNIWDLDTIKEMYEDIIIIENEEKELINKVDTMEVYGIMCSIFISIVIIYPTWWLLGRAIPWKDCNPYIWLYALEFVASVGTINYQAYVSAKKDTKAIRNIALIGGICVRIPLVMIVKYANLGLIGLSVACGIDRIIRTIYLRLYIRKKLIKEETIVLNKKIEVKV